MQSPLFGYTEVQSQDRYTLQNPKLLRVALTGHEDVLARKGSMVAYQGMLEFDGEYQSGGQRRATGDDGRGPRPDALLRSGHRLSRQPRAARPRRRRRATRA